MNKTILITGGAGFIGSHLTSALVAAGHNVRILDTLNPQIHGALPAGLDWLDGNTNIEFIRGSVTNRAALTAALKGVQSIVHLASETGTGQSMYQIARYSDENVQGTAMLMDILATEPELEVTRVLLSSSRSIYGEGAYIRPSDGVPLTPDARSAAALKAHIWEPVCPETGEILDLAATREDDRTAPSSIYAATKLMQEDLVRITCDSLGLGYGILRLQNVYGEGQSLNNPYTGILSIFSTRIRRGLELPIFEDGQESRDFVHVSDVATAFCAALDRSEAPNQAINVGSGYKTPVIDIAAALSRAFGTEPNLVVTEQYRLGDIRHNYADTTRLAQLLNAAPQIGIEDGLRRFAAWVSTQALPEDRLDAANAELKTRNMMG